MDPRHLERLQEQQRKAISDTDSKIEQMRQFKEDYKVLQERLRTLPDKLTHSVMVPFGKLGFMPGQLVHTNEILVLLGDNWFIERSAKQATEIADRRIKELEKKLSDLEAQGKLLEPRLAFTSQIQAELQGQEDVKEIVEEFDEAKEKLWDEQHRRNVRKHKEEVRRNLDLQNSLQKTEADIQKTDSSFWSRLDELEKQEAERNEIESLPLEDDENHEVSQTSGSSDISSKSSRRVAWADDVKDERVSDESSDDGSTEEDEDDDDENDQAETVRKPIQKTITFKHTQTSSPSSLPSSSQLRQTGDTIIQSPAEIYRLVSRKSILKKTSDSEHLWASTQTNSLTQQDSVTFSSHGGTFSSATSTESDQHLDTPVLPSPSDASKAFTGLVVEKSSTSQPSVPPSGTDTPLVSDDQIKPLSKFRASRIRHNPA